MQKLTTDQVKFLLGEYNNMPARIKNLEERIAQGNPDENIYSMSVAQVVSDMPYGGQISDKTQNLALCHDKILDTENSQIMQLISTFRQAYIETGNALESLSAEEKDLVMLSCVERKKWIDAFEKINAKHGVMSDSYRRKMVKKSLQKSQIFYT
ncbi:MAG: hypothetical protein E7476_03600 [Ruminococcaceae bacterium]|nr:hypothetical protein [Oscillospiraceae bacterium]